MFLQTAVLINLAELTEKDLCRSLFFNNLADFRLATSLQKGLRHKCFPMSLAKFSRAAFLIDHIRWLLLSLLPRIKKLNDIAWAIKTKP